MIDVIAAFLLVAVLLIVGALLFTNPYAELERQHDVVRHDGVRDLMEAMLELQQEQPEVFWDLLEELDEEAMMVGTGTVCGGPATVAECSQDMLCLDLTETLASYLAALPSDPLVTEYSASSSGYYMLYDDSVLEIGACAPQQQEAIRLMSFIE